jgi:hypothetical protein
MRAPIILASFIGLGLASAKRRRISTNSSLNSFAQNFDIPALLLIGAFYTVSFYFIYPGFALLHGSDIQRYYANSVLLSRTPELFKSHPYILYNSWEGISIILGKDNAVDLKSFVCMFASSLAFLGFILPLSFYLLAKEYLAPFDKRLPILSTMIWSLFSGFSWLYLFKLKAEEAGGPQLNLLLQVNNKSNGIFWYLTKPEILWFDPSTVAFAIFMIQLLLMRRFAIPRSKYVILFGCLTVTGFFTHVYETIILSIFFSLYCVSCVGGDFRIKDSLKGFLAGFTFVLLLLSFGSIISEVHLDLITVAIVSLFLMIFTLSLRQKIFLLLRRKINLHSLKTITIIVAAVGVFIYGASLLTWLFDAKTYTLSSIIELHFVPWFMYPVLLGITGLLGILSLPYIIKYENLRQRVGFFLAFFIFSLLFGRMLSYVNLYLLPTVLQEDRLLAFSFIPSALMASITLISLHKLKRQSFLMKAASLALIALIVVCGIQTTYMKIEYWNIRTDPKVGDLTNEEEFQAFNFLSNLFNVDKHALLVSVTQESLSKLVFSAPPMKISYPNILFGAKHPEMALIYLKASSDSHPYIYFADRDVKALNQYGEGWMAKHLIPMLPTIYEKGGVKIYNVSDISFPQPTAVASLVIPFDKSLDLEESWLFVYDLLSQGRYSYNVLYDLDGRTLLHPILVLSFDPPQGNVRIIEFTNNPKLWGNVFGSWQCTEEGLLGSGGSPKEYGESTIVSSIPPQGYFNVTAKFRLLNGDLNVPNYVSIIYDWIDSTNYKAAGLCFTKDGVYAYFATYKGPEIKVYPGWPGAITGLKYKLGDSFELTLSISGAESTLYLNGSKIYSISIPYEGGKIGLRITRFYDVLFTKTFMSLPLQTRPANEYLKYVDEGGILIVLNSNGYGYFTDYMLTREGKQLQAEKIINKEGVIITDLPLLQVDSFKAKKASANPLAYYSSSKEASSIYALEENIGRGKLILVNIHPILHNIAKNFPPSLLYTINSKLLMPINSYLENFEYSTKPLTATFKEFTLNGRFEINSPSVIFPKNLFLKNVSIETEGKKISINNIIRLNVYNATGVNIFGTGSLKLSNGLGFYSNLQILGSVVVNVTGNNASVLLLTEDNKTFMRTSNTIIIGIESDSPMNLVLRQPQVVGKGDFFFKELYSSGSVYQKTRCNGKDLSGNGIVDFTIYVSDTYTWLSGLNIEGSFMRQPPLLIFNELSTLFGFLFSWFLIALLLSAFMLILLTKNRE